MLLSQHYALVTSEARWYRHTWTFKLYSSARFHSFLKQLLLFTSTHYHWRRWGVPFHSWSE